MKVQTGNWVSHSALLALYKFYVDASDEQLADMKIERADVLNLARSIEADMGGYSETELATIAHQLLRAYRVGKTSLNPPDHPSNRPPSEHEGSSGEREE